MQINMNQTVVSMVEDGLLTFEQVQDLIRKNSRQKARDAKRKRKNAIKAIVSEKLETLLVKPGATVKHRTVWLAAGKDEYSRDEILNALRSLREEGLIKNIKTSNNNFQVFWAYTVQPEANIFGTLNEVNNEA